MTARAASTPVVRLQAYSDRAPFARGDHVEIAERLEAHLRASGEVVHEDGQTWRYSEKSHVFEAVPPSELSQIVQTFAGCKVHTSRDKMKPLMLRASDVSGAIRLAQDRFARPGFFAGAPAGVVFESCFVEVRPDGIVQHEHSPRHRARFAYSFGFQPDPKPRRLLEFFQQVFRDDADASQKIDLLQEYVGSAMLGLATRYQRALTNFGSGANGKSVIATIIERAMPRGSVVAIAPQDFGNEYRAAMLAGKLMNIVAELPEADILDSEAFKSVIAGDSRTARHIRCDPFTFKPVAGHIFAANRLPGTTDQTHGFWRRFIVLGFNRIFLEHEQDSTLAEKILNAELPAIVSWFVLGARRALHQGGYTVPSSSDALVQKWRKSADQVRGFLDECATALPVDAAPLDGSKASAVYRAYRTWAADNGHRPLASNKFGERMGQIGYPSRHTDLGNYYPVRLERHDP